MVKKTFNDYLMKIIILLNKKQNKKTSKKRWKLQKIYRDYNSGHL